MTSKPYGVVLGRFQPLHLGHLEYLEAARRRCECLVVGITNPDTAAMVAHFADPNRSKLESNPFSFFQRYEMINRSLCDLGWPAGCFAIVPAEISNLGQLQVFLPNPAESTFFVTIYDAWGEEKMRRLQELDYAVEVLWRRSMTDRLTSGTALRKLMRANGDWQSFVPRAVIECVERSGILPSGRK